MSKRKSESPDAPANDSTTTLLNPVQQRLYDWIRTVGLPNATKLRKQNPLPMFDDCVEFFEEEHYYVVDGLRYRGSGTSVVHSVFEPFNEQVMLDRIVNGRRWATDPDYRYYQMPRQDIAALWEHIRTQASLLGTIMHAYIECFYNDVKPDWASLGVQGPDDLGLEYTHFHTFHDEIVEGKLKPWRTELILVDPAYEFVGTIDMLFQDLHAGPDDRTLFMMDHKRSKEIRHKPFNPTDLAYEPFNELANINKHHYFLQLNLYKFVLERNTPYRVKTMHLSVFHPTQSSFVLVEVPDLQHLAAKLCGMRRFNLIQADRAHLARVGSDPIREKHLNRLLAFPDSLSTQTNDPRIGVPH